MKTNTRNALRLLIRPLRCTHAALFLTIVAALFAPSAHASLILSATPIGTSMSNPDLNKLVDGVGLSPGYTVGDDFATVVANNTYTGGGTLGWGSQPTLTGTIDFDLGAPVVLSEFAIWNAFSTELFDRAIDEFTLFTDTESGFSSPTNVGTFNNPQSTVDGTLFELTPSTGQYVRVQINSNHGSTIITSVGEFAFGAVPEASEALVILLGMTGLLGARRRMR